MTATWTDTEKAEVVRIVLDGCSGDRAKAAAMFNRTLGKEIAELQQELDEFLTLLDHQ